MENHIATIWNKHLDLFPSTIDEHHVEILSSSILSNEFQFLVFYGKTIYPNLVTPRILFNSVCFDTYFGNVAHGIVHKVLTILKHTGNSMYCYRYINLLFLIKYNFDINLEQRDYYNETPYDTLESFKRRHFTFFLHDRECYTPCVAFNILHKLTNTNYCILRIAQSYIRRMLAIKKVRKLRYRRILDILLISPPKQVEYKCFNSFPGGSKYLEHNRHFEDLQYGTI